MKLINTILLSLSVLVLQAQHQQFYMIVGTYTSGKSEGIYVYKFNNATGKVDSVTMIKTDNPSYLAINDRRFVYAVNEGANNGNGGSVSAFSFDKKTGALKFIDQRPSVGDDPCYVSIDKTKKWIAIANYTSGTFSILPIRKDGGLDSAVEAIQHKGGSVNKERQEGAHAHCTVFSKDNKYLLVADLGMDKVMVYPFDQRTGKVGQPDSQAIVKPGVGPRQIVFDSSGKFVYVIAELAGTVSVYKFLNGKLDLIQNLSTVPTDFKGFAGSADIHISADGRFLYASNRGESNTLAIFKIEMNGKLTLVGHQSTLGIAPRYFSLVPDEEKYLMIGNQDSDDIVIFKRNNKTGLLIDTHKRISVGKPVCLKWSYIGD